MEIKRIRNYLSAQTEDKPHWAEFVQAWK
ncbi:hypothetical protein [Neisseria gonorrhoeae]